MSFETYLSQQISAHPSARPQDIVKLCFQAAYGAEHLLSDCDAARNYLEREYADTKAKDIPLYEKISRDVCRVNLAAWKFRKLPVEWLFNIFSASASVQKGSKEFFLECLEIAEEVLRKAQIAFPIADWKEYLEEYKKSGMTAVHHSREYRECENPAYRIVDSGYIRLFPILEKVAKLLPADKPCVIAIDGRAASGKTTMANRLKMILEADVIQMDDFFLPMELRTPERFEMPGGNIHHERFIEEVLPYISISTPFSYRRFDCRKLDYNGDCMIRNAHFRIVEGSYSCHPVFGDYADVTVFSDVEAKEQIHRILHRNGDAMAEMFQNRWIPLEEKYFEEYRISSTAHILV